jgi:hypothetical protein
MAQRRLIPFRGSRSARARQLIPRDSTQRIGARAPLRVQTVVYGGFIRLQKWFLLNLYFGMGLSTKESDDIQLSTKHSYILVGMDILRMC